MRTVLIFAHECAPYNRPESMVGAQRPAQFAKYLPQFGWRAVVVCADARRRYTASRGDEGRIRAEVRERLAELRPDASLVIPTPSLATDGLIDRAWKTAQNRALPLPRARVAARRLLTFAKFPLGDYSQSWQPCARWAAELIAERVRVDACVGEHSPDAGVFVARWFSAKYSVPWVADFRDPILQPFKPLARVLYTPVARWLMRTAAATANVNTVWADQDRSLFKLPSISVPNGYDPDEFRGAPPDDGARPFTIAYLGNINDAQRIDLFLEGLSRAVERSAPGAFDGVRFLYRGGTFSKVDAAARRFGVERYVDAAGQIPRSEAIAELERADALLLLSVATPEAEERWYRHGMYPAKVFEYFGARRPIVLVPGDRGILDDLVRTTRTGSILRSLDEIAAFLEDVVAAAALGRGLPYEPDLERVARYTRSSLAGEFARLLDMVAERAGAAAPARVGTAEESERA